MDDEEIIYINSGNIEVSKRNRKKRRNLECSKEDLPVLNIFKVDYQGGRPILVKKESEKATKTMQKSYNVKFWLFYIIMLLVVFIAIYDKYSYNRKLNTQDIIKELNDFVINQNEVLIQIEKVLVSTHTINEDTNVKVMNFLGTTGVGKSFCANIIQHGFKPKQVYHVNIKETQDITLSKNVPYLLILDDLMFSDINKLITFLQTLPDNRLIIVINMFNVHDTKDMKTHQINDNYFYEIPLLFKQNTKLPVHNLIFNGFNQKVVRDNIKILLMQYGGFIDDNHLANAIERHNFELFGLKGFFGRLNVNF